jgi:ABC-type transport system involved in multi-copper enzyme maturation permease subunit
MIFTLILKEIRSHILSFRFGATMAVAAALMVSSAWVLSTAYEEELRAYQAFQAQHERQVGSYETGADTPLGALSMGGRIIDRRPPKLGFLLAGVHGAMPKSFWISAHDGPTPETNLVRNRLRELFERVDYRFIVGIIFSLLALLLTYDAINGERRDGTLRLALANPVRIRDLLFAKWVGINLLLTISFGLSMLAALAVGLMNPLVELDGGSMMRLALLAGLSVLYLAVFVSLGLLLSALFREPYTAVAVGLLLWVALVFVVPGAAPLAAAASEEVPSYVSAVLERQDDLGYNYREIRQRHLDEGKDWYEASDLTNRFWSEVVEPKRTRQAMRANEEFLNRRVRLVERGRQLARLSPYGSFSFAATGVAGGGVGEQLRFEREVEAYRRRFKDFIKAQEEAERQREVTPEEVPVFELRPQSLREAASTALPDSAVLAVLSLGLFGLAFLRMQHYDVR